MNYDTILIFNARRKHEHADTGQIRIFSWSDDAPIEARIHWYHGCYGTIFHDNVESGRYMSVWIFALDNSDSDNITFALLPRDETAR